MVKMKRRIEITSVRYYQGGYFIISVTIIKNQCQLSFLPKSLKCVCVQKIFIKTGVESIEILE